MRRASGRHGTGGRGVPALAGTASPSRSASVTLGWVRGSSRKNQIQTAIQIRLAAPSATNEPRHDTTKINEAINGGVSALPIRDAEWVMPWAKPHRVAGSQVAIARVAVGNAAPSPKPSARRTRNREVSPPTAPVSAVDMQTISAEAPSVRRGPSLSPSQPPISWKTA